VAVHWKRQATDSAIGSALFRARVAQSLWAAQSVRERLRHLRHLRNAIAHDPQTLLDAVRLTRSASSPSEILSSEVLPLLDAIKFLGDKAEELLRVTKPDNAMRPFWLAGVHLEIHRQSVGTALIISPSNYPLFLPGVQLVQALAAGNAVLIKPGAGASPAMLALHDYAVRTGVPRDLITVLDESPETASEAIIAGVDKIWLTGSAKTGRAVAKLAAESLTPLVCELSGCDAVIVLPGADAALAARAVVFGLKMNGSRTCMRPHRLVVHQSLEPAFRRELLHRLSSLKISIERETALRLQALLNDAEQHGAIRLQGDFDGRAITPFVMVEVDPNSSLWNADIFSPVLALNSFESWDEAVHLHNYCEYGLTASIFGPEADARTLASRLQAGTVVLNDIIVPTADPRLPFSATKHSGFGTTRGAEGLLEFTRPRAIAVRRSGYRHLDAPHASDAAMFTGALQAAHRRGFVKRVQGALHAMKAVMRRHTAA
jgi:acyl-CoA reductase-like NAD-dependent aldehyde dehydrogenase